MTHRPAFSLTITSIVFAFLAYRSVLYDGFSMEGHNVVRAEVVALIRTIHTSGEAVSDDDYQRVMGATREELKGGIPEAGEADLDRLIKQNEVRFYKFVRPKPTRH